MAKTPVEKLQGEITASLKAHPGRDRAPDGFERFLTSVCDVTDESYSNERELLKSSLYFWGAYVSSCHTNPELKGLLAQLTPEELRVLLSSLRGVTPCEGLVEALTKAFTTVKRAPGRQRSLEAAGLGSAIPSAKRPCVEQQQQQQQQHALLLTTSSPPRVYSHLFTVNSMTMESADSTLDGNLQSHGAPLSTNNLNPIAQTDIHDAQQFWATNQQHMRLPNAQYLPMIFEARCIDDIVIVDGSKAALKFEYRVPPDESTLKITVHEKAIFRLANELFNQTMDIEYDQADRSWVKKLKNGADLYCGEWFKLKNPNNDAVTEYFGKKVISDFQSNPKRFTELMAGQSELTKQVTLEARIGSDGILNVFMDAQKLTALESALCNSHL